MKNRKIPMRSCIITKEKLPKADLLRIVKTPDGKILPDLSGKLNGRGAYIKKDIDVLEKAKKSKILDKIFETEITNDIFDDIKEIINKK